MSINNVPSIIISRLEDLGWEQDTAQTSDLIRPFSVAYIAHAQLGMSQENKLNGTGMGNCVVKF